jgi:PAS domain S-box-containing protein
MNEEIGQKSEKFKLEKSHDLLRALFDSSLDAFLIANDEACYVDANVAACEMLGYEREELLRMSVWDVTPEPSGAAARQLWRDFIAGGRQSGEYQIRQKNGTLREVEYRAVANILPGLHLSVLRDISRRKQAEEAIRKSNQRLQEVLSSITDAYIALDWEWRFIELNPVAEELIFGRSADYLTGKNIWTEYPQEIASNFYQQCRVAVETGRTAQFETKSWVANRWFIVHLYPREDRLEIYMRDITKPKVAEEALLDLNAELDERVQARTKELEVLNQVLQLEIKEREQIEAELAELQRHLMDRVEAEQMSLARELHDGPMQDLLAISYRIAKLQENHPEMSQILDGLKDDILRTNQALRNVSQDLRPASLVGFGLEAAIREYADRYHETNPELQIQLKIGAINDELAGAVNLALFRIYQVAINNILRHAEASRAEVRLALNGDQVILEIEDDGRGFEVPERWIELARKGHLGLVGAKERADAVGGQLEVVSQPGKGTVIRVVAPVEKCTVTSER